jgi:hypothetical protein
MRLSIIALVLRIGLSLAKQPLIQLMGGIKFTDAEQFVADTVFLASILAFLSFPVWLQGCSP